MSSSDSPPSRNIYCSSPGTDRRKYWTKLTRLWMQDRFGFPNSTGGAVLYDSTLIDVSSELKGMVADENIEKQWLEKYDNAAKQKRLHWEKFLQKYEDTPVNEITGNDAKILKSLIRKGVPKDMRAKVWMEMSGAAALRNANPGYYHEILAKHQGESSKAIEDIERDLDRTYPSHPLFRTNSEGISTLRRVLVAYSWRNPSVGYCQSLNFIAALLILYLNEEDVFWLLAEMLETLMPEDFYVHSLVGLRVDQLVLKRLMSEYLPKLHRHFEDLGVEPAIFCTGWFMCAYSEYFPPETTFRIWDALFNEGWKILFRIALAFLKMNSKALLKCTDLGQIIQCSNIRARYCFDCDALLRVAFSIPHFPRSHIQKSREVHSGLTERERERDRQRTEKERLRRLDSYNDSEEDLSVSNVWTEADTETETDVDRDFGGENEAETEPEGESERERETEIDGEGDSQSPTARRVLSPSTPLVSRRLSEDLEDAVPSTESEEERERVREEAGEREREGTEEGAREGEGESDGDDQSNSVYRRRSMGRKLSINV